MPNKHLLTETYRTMVANICFFLLHYACRRPYCMYVCYYRNAYIKRFTCCGKNNVVFIGIIKQTSLLAAGLWLPAAVPPACVRDADGPWSGVPIGVYRDQQGRELGAARSPGNHQPQLQHVLVHQHRRW